MNRRYFAVTSNARPVAWKDIPIYAETSLHNIVARMIESGWRLSSLFALPDEEHHHWLVAVVTHDESSEIGVAAAHVGSQYISITPHCHSAHWFEREIAEEWNIHPAGHPWLKPIRFSPGRDSSAAKGKRPIIGVTEFFSVEGQEIHEVGVGPVHAGVIEPGHFRFQCHGEDVLHLEISLGYQHRGIERRLVGGPDARTLHYMETLAGDTTVGHSMAYCHIIEALRQVKVSKESQLMRAMALELERLANHVGDLGALANDVAFLPTASFCGRLRGDFLNMTALLCGNRFGRGLVRPGGVRFGAGIPRLDELDHRMEAAMPDVMDAAKLLFEASTVQSRFHETGVVTHKQARDAGLVGVAARASGLITDVRHYFPCGAYAEIPIEPAVWHSGDVFARAWVRWKEIESSARFIKSCRRSLTEGVSETPSLGSSPLMPDSLVVSLIEGWRGEICHVAMTDDQGRFKNYKVTDPSFHNWFGLALSLRDQQISDFPICNKSFNLSYCGHDL